MADLEASLRSLIDAAGDEGIFGLDAEARIRWWSRGAERIFEWTATEIVGQPWSVLWGGGARDSEALREAFERARNRERPLPVEIRARRRRGQGLQCRLTIALAGEPQAGFTLLARDVGAAVANADEIQRDRSRLRHFVDTAIIGLVACRFDGRILEANDYFLRLVGRSREDLARGKLDWRELTPEEHLATDLRKIAEARARGACEPYEKQYRRSDGRLVWVTLGYTVAPDSADVALAYVLDISDRKAAQEELQRERDVKRTLLDEVAERASELEAALEAIADPILVFDGAGVVRRANRAAFDLLGFEVVGHSREEIVRRLRPTRSDGTPVPSLAMPSAQALAGVAPLSEPLALVDARGGRRVALMSAAQLRHGDETFGAVSVWHDITENERLHARVSAQKQLFESVFESTQVGIVVFDGADRRVRWANRAFREMLDEPYRSGQILGLSLDDFLPRALESGVIDIFERVLRTGIPHLEHEFRIDGFARGTTWWRWALSRLPAAGGEREVLLTATEVTDAVLARRQVEEDAVRFQTILETLPVGVILADAHGQITGANPIAQRIWGGEVPEVRSLEGYRVFRGRWSESGRSLRPQDWAIARALTRGEITFGDRIDIERFDGTGASILNSAAPLRDARGRIFGAVAVMQDVTRQRELEIERAALANQLTAQASELEAVIESIADPVVVFGAGGEVRILNAAARRLELTFERAHPRVRGAPLLLADGRLPTPDETPVARALRGERVSGIVLHTAAPKPATALPVAATLRPAEGPAILWMSASAAPIRAAGRVAGAVATLVDVTHLHELQEQREGLVRMISHDLRTPLSTVILQAQLLQRDPGSDERVLKRAATISTSAARINTLIQDLVDMARLETGQLNLELGPVELGRFLPELAERLAGTLEMWRVRLQVPPGLPPVLADGARLERILVNLLSNALKYSEPGSEVELKAEPRGERVTLTVTDVGQGIAADEIPKLFQRYYRSERTRKTEGLGLGLYITRLLVGAQGGRIEVRSELGRGSSFSVELKRADLERRPDAGEGVSESADYVLR